MHFHRTSFESEEHHILHDYLKGRIPNVGTATDKFVSPVEDKWMNSRSTSEVEALLWREWSAVVKVAFITAWQDDEWRQKLVNFVLAVKQKPVLESNGQLCQIDGRTVWKDLPVFGAQMREAWSVGTATDADECGSESKQEKWLNINAFTAALVSAVAASHQQDPDFSLYGIWTIRTALEEPLKNGSNMDNTSLKAAALWFIHAATAMKGFCKTEKPFDGKLAKAGALFSGEFNGYSMDRWRIWNRRLQEASQAPNLDEDAKALVSNALKAMQEAK